MSVKRGAVNYGKERIEFSFFHTERKTLEIAVHPDQSVTVKAPFGVGIEEISNKIRKRAAWVTKQQAFFRQFDPRTPARRYVGGETHLYLGRRYRLKIKSGDHNVVKLMKGFFNVQIQGQMSSDKVKSLVDAWYRDKARTQFTESLDRCWSYLEKFINAKPRLQIRRVQKRWGSLSANGMLTINLDLVRAPKECIDYVIIHELSHMRYKSHSYEFYRFLDKVMPDWERRKHRLEITLA